MDKRVDDYNYLTVIEGKIYRDDPKRIVRNKWEIDDWRQRVLNWKNLIQDKRKLSEINQKTFWNLVLDHPKVPLDLLPKNWPLKDLVKQFDLRKF